MRQASAKLRNTADGRNHVINAGGLNNVLNENMDGLATTLAKWIDGIRAISPQVEVAICTIPQVLVRDVNLQRVVVTQTKRYGG